MAFLIGVLSPFFNKNELLASTEKSPVIGFAVCAPKTSVTKNASFISSSKTLSLKSKIMFEPLTEGVPA